MNNKMDCNSPHGTHTLHGVQVKVRITQTRHTGLLGGALQLQHPLPQVVDGLGLGCEQLVVLRHRVQARMVVWNPKPSPRPSHRPSHSPMQSHFIRA